MEVIHEPTEERSATPGESTAQSTETAADSSSPHVSEPTTKQPATWPRPTSTQQRTTGQRDLLIVLLLAGIALDSYELLGLITDLSVVLGTILRFIVIPVEALYFVVFLYLCWREHIPAAQRRVINGLRFGLSLLNGFELFANFVPIIGGLLEALPLKTITIIALFYLRPLTERLFTQAPAAGEVIHAADRKSHLPRV